MREARVARPGVRSTACSRRPGPGVEQHDQHEHRGGRRCRGRGRQPGWPDHREVRGRAVRGGGPAANFSGREGSLSGGVHAAGTITGPPKYSISGAQVSGKGPQDLPGEDKFHLRPRVPAARGSSAGSGPTSRTRRTGNPPSTEREAFWFEGTETELNVFSVDAAVLGPASGIVLKGAGGSDGPDQRHRYPGGHAQHDVLHPGRFPHRPAAVELPADRGDRLHRGTQLAGHDPGTPREGRRRQRAPVQQHVRRVRRDGGSRRGFRRTLMPFAGCLPGAAGPAGARRRGAVRQPGRPGDPGQNRTSARCGCAGGLRRRGGTVTAVAARP